ncbi:Oligosaccharide biosynthesis protein Alg14 like [Acetitomaculum ruminis DSM 5522]|uniref:Oligosaccharide biosynthesis protein Alg14 like n=1 Tax=Acetitomaculum ruminis DSM 5522 TaxID=1120918 RepID=A0A1I0Z0R9_9FIRM|nr:PssD/Cps14F family polysaccharide biosynthesis glycosyltransferase [Acetitomaculum ruminis]SFB19012.1 Oligosaccharide biosynthesis protein Alg14 like [Acetitomaculum ruminis DSM 5522]
MANNKQLKICFAASSGGHFEQLMMLKPLMEKYDSFIFTEKTPYTVKNKDIKTYYVPQINRKELFFPIKIIHNFFLALSIVMREKPDVMITTGVLAVVPLAFILKIFGGKLIYLESFAKVNSATISGKTLYKIADRFYVQWEEMKEIFPNAIYKGGIY